MQMNVFTLMQMKSSLKRVWAKAGFVWSLVLQPVPMEPGQDCTSTCSGYAGVVSCCYFHSVWHCPFSSSVTASIMSSPHHCGQSHIPHQDRFETKAFVRHQVLLLPSDSECFMPGKHPPWPLVVAKGIWGCWGSLPGTWPRTTAGGMDVPGAWLCFPWGFGNRCSDGYLLSSISCALCDGCLWNSSLQVLWCGYCNMPWAFTVKNLLENLGICIYPL